MSLFKQLLIAICLFLVVAFSGSFMVSLESSRTQYVNQLRSHAQDAATALALSLTPNIDDPAMVELLVSSIFDSGYYASIRVIDVTNDQVIVERSGIPDNNGVPNWFVKLIGLEPAGGDALVSRGWEQAARVEVVSHPMFALAKLWQSALGSLGWLLLCGAVSAVLGALLLRRQLKPLDYMVKQSHAIARREFLSLPDLPRTPELRRVVQAMNQMVEKLKALFQEQAERSEKLRVESSPAWPTAVTSRCNSMRGSATPKKPAQATCWCCGSRTWPASTSASAANAPTNCCRRSVNSCCASASRIRKPTTWSPVSAVASSPCWRRG